MEKQGCICQEMQALLKEQRFIAGIDTEFQFICLPKKMDTIPFMLYSTDKNEPFRAFDKGVATPFFRIEELDEVSCCAVLSLLQAIDMEGNPIDSCDNLFALRKTTSCVIVNLNCFCAIQSLPLEYVNRSLPIIEPKC